MAQVMTDKKKPKEGIPCSEKELKEHLKAFEDIEESIKYIDKPRHWKK